MSKKMVLKLSIDFIMIVLMLFAFAYQLTDNTIHEIIGILLLLFFVLHNMLNRNWYKAFCQGKYSAMRVIGNTMNILLLITMGITMVTGMMLSHDLVAFLVRKLHVFSANWGIVLISVHLGMHGEMIVSKIKKIIVIKSEIFMVILSLIFVAVAAYGIKASFALNMGAKLFLQAAFSFWDFENHTGLFFMSYIAMMALYVFITYYFLKLINADKKRRE